MENPIENGDDLGVVLWLPKPRTTWATPWDPGGKSAASSSTAHDWASSSRGSCRSFCWGKWMECTLCPSGYIYIYTYVYIHIYIYIYTYTHIYIYMVYMVYIYIYICITLQYPLVNSHIIIIYIYICIWLWFLYSFYGFYITLPFGKRFHRYGTSSYAIFLGQLTSFRLMAMLSIANC